MKYIFTKPLTLTFVGALIILIITIICCKKIEEINNPMKSSSDLMQFYDAKLIESFKNEPVAKEFIREANTVPVRIVNGMLSFKSADDYDKVYDLIISYTDKYDELLEKNENFAKYADWEKMPEDIMAFLFESEKGFYSLRAHIEEQLQTLNRGKGIPEDNDPDDHHVVSPYQRSLLSPDCEVIINDLIYVFYDTYHIGIMHSDWKTLRELHEWQKRYNFDERKALEFCSGKPEAFFLTTGSEPTLYVDFTYMTDEKNPEKIQFFNYSCSEAYKDMKYRWDFGDGTTSTERNPKHTFDINAKAGTVVCLTVENVKSSKVPNTECQPIPFPPPPPSKVVNFTYSEGNAGDVSFNSTSNYTQDIVHYTWSFGDYTQDMTVYDTYIGHQYASNGTYSVTLTVTYNDFSTKSCTKSVQVQKYQSGGGGEEDCCKANPRDAEKDGLDYTYGGENRRIKLVMRATNVYQMSHRLCAKTKHMKENFAGDWVMKNAAVINAGYGGIIFWVADNCNEGCGCPQAVSEMKTEKTNHYQRVCDVGYGRDNPFRVSYESVTGRHKVVIEKGIVKIDGLGNAAIHDIICK